MAQLERLSIRGIRNFGCDAGDEQVWHNSKHVFLFVSIYYSNEKICYNFMFA